MDGKQNDDMPPVSRAFVPDPKISAWHSAGSTQDADSFARETYELAKICFKNVKGAENLDAGTKMGDAYAQVVVAMNAYKSKPESKAFKWLSAFSDRVVHYAVVLDVLAQHHPEYVSLAWGVFKLIFMSIVNQETIVKELAKALSKIADVLPRATLALRLYRTQPMQHIAASLYARLMRFLIKVQEWLQKGKLSHALGAVFNPWSLGFEESLVHFEEEAKKLSEYAEAALQAEMRDVHIEVQLTKRELVSTRELLQNALSEQQTVTKAIRADLNENKVLISKTLSASLLSLPFLSRFPPSGESLAFCQSLQKRSRRDFKALIPDIPTLDNWSSSFRTTLLVASMPPGHSAKDFLVDLISIIKQTPHPLIWCLRFPRFWDQKLDLLDVIRILTLQAMQINPDALTATSSTITAASLREASCEGDWLAILNRALVGIGKVYVILDSDLLAYASGHNRHVATKWLENVLRSITSSNLKIVVAIVNLDSTHIIRTWDPKLWMMLNIQGAEKGPNRHPVVHRRQELRRRAFKRRHI
ncbi:hypothetical protein DL766_004863 [Monosporascus sp. MC13-8B]|uniref:DUF7708 domain-containing protein n=1 Tax=Monosporascus cannonballus TaxID=155416 RepID=A0ABY0H207_9PEZI|nr:hypothetical protein DL762_007537 [Monosporascus cannonballus]RYP30470.1 hypothetical protein DL766_004863 [Monosporascus sp. MC13-8B]